MRIIAVVMGEPDSKTRNKEVSEMLDYAYAQYTLTNVIKKNQVLDTITIEKSKDDKYDIISLEDINILHKKGEEVDKNYTLNLKKISAPIKHGDSVGKVIINNGNKIDVTISKDVEEVNIIEQYLKCIKNIFVLN